MTVLSEVNVGIYSEADIVAARQQARAVAQRAGFQGADLTVIATAISELARNIVDYALPGEITLRAIRDGARQGIVVIASDQGPGIADVSLALQRGYTSGKGLGMGLPGVRGLMDEFDIASSPGCGTTLTMKKWSL